MFDVEVVLVMKDSDLWVLGLVTIARLDVLVVTSTLFRRGDGNSREIDLGGRVGIAIGRRSRGRSGHDEVMLR